MSDKEAELGDGHGGVAARAAVVFNPWLASPMDRIPKAFAENLISGYVSAKPRQRALKSDVVANLEAITEKLIVNLGYAVALGHEPPSVAVSLRSATRKLTRYDREGFSLLPRLLDALVETGANSGIFTLAKSAQRGTSSSITAGPLIKEVFGQAKIGAHLFYQQRGSETIRLSRTAIDYTAGGRRDYEWIDYEDTEETARLRGQMQRINDRLAGADAFFTPPKEVDAKPVALRQTELRRYFKLLPADTAPRFDQGGRLFGGWWQGVPRRLRSAIRIDHQPVADLDFSNMFLRLAYLRAGHEPPPGDLYAMVPGFEDRRWRDGVKLTVNAMLFRDTPLKRLPRPDAMRDVLLEGEGEKPTRGIAEMLPPGTRGPALRSAILAGHPKLEGVFETGAGFSLMFTESQILVTALERLAEDAVTALPMHDGIMVGAINAPLAVAAMRDAAEQITGFRLPVERKPVG